MAPDDPLLPIGAFARAAGVTPSMLRFYADCGLVRPAETDPRTGYRRYAPDQVDRVRLVRRLRELGLPLPVVARTVDAGPDEADAVLRDRLAELEEQLRAARASAAEAARLLRRRAGRSARVAAGALAAAVRRVSPAAGGCPEAPVLAGVLLEVAGGELHLVATDRYRLAAHTLPLAGAPGEGRTVLPVEELTDVVGWAGEAGEVLLSLTATGLTAHRPDGAVREVPALEGRYPDHRALLDGLGRPVTRVAAARGALLAALADASVSRLVACPRTGVRVDGGSGTGPVAVPGSVRGAPATMAFRRSTLLPAVEASLGPDVVLEVVGPAAPVLVRSADDGTFSTLAMPTFELPTLELPTLEAAR
ncbi:DNA polymerase III subunit beta family protein [Geodermatophilus sp. SYSU D00815]